jgi:hypothetical protein
MIPIQHNRVLCFRQTKDSEFHNTSIFICSASSYKKLGISKGYHKHNKVVALKALKEGVGKKITLTQIIF